MASTVLRQHSLKSRITLFTLAIFLLSLWSLSFYASQMLRQDMERLLYDQQFSTATFMAAEVNQQLDDRFRVLEIAAGNIGPAILENTSALQAYVEGLLFVKEPFNAGVMVLGLDATAIADTTRSAGRIGVNCKDSNAIAPALEEGRNTIGRPVLGRVLGKPVFAMAVPIRDVGGKVIGAMAGVTNLGLPNFLDRVTANRYGKTGGYVIAAPQYRMIVTATDKSRVMASFPPAGVDPVIDRVTGGDEGSVVYVSATGIEMVTSSKPIPLAGWNLVALLPTAEAFAPIRDMRQRMLIATLLLTVLAAGLTWWMLQRQFLPLRAAARALAGQRAKDQPWQALPIAGEDEIGELVDGFNRLLETLEQREKALRESEERWKFALEGSEAGVWDWNIQTGEAFYSRRWKEMLGFAESEIGTGSSEWSDRVHPADLPGVMATIQAHLEGKSASAEVEFRMLCKDGRWRWILGRGMVVSRTADGRPLRLVGTNTDVSGRKALEEQVRQLAYHDALTRLPNRRLLGDRLRQTMAASARSGMHGALMFLDLDNFKPLNDAQGHEVGDLLLIEAAERMKNCVREMDTVARFGGDEFVVMISELDVDHGESLAQAGIVAEKIRHALSEPYRLTVRHAGNAEQTIVHRCTVSIGVALFIDHQASQEEVIKCADATMYRAKDAGRNRILFHDQSTAPLS